MELNGKVFVVTGGGSGIGRALTLQLLLRGARVAAVDINPSTLHQTRDLSGADEGQLMSKVASVSDREVIGRLPKEVIDHFGQVDGLINNAGIIQPFVRLCDLDFSGIERVLSVNLMGTLTTIKAFLPFLLARPEAYIANVSSMGGFVPVPGQSVYGAAKAAVKLLSEGLASELGATNVRVSVICPGAVATGIMDNSGVRRAALSRKSTHGSKLKPLSPTEAAKTILRGIERDRRYIFVGKDAWMIDKLYRLSPIFASSLIARKMAGLLAPITKNIDSSNGRHAIDEVGGSRM
jgi:NAD(P)-dependent dehydrogenase (short-subunit alcohol dehydrogenase family)